MGPILAIAKDAAPGEALPVIFGATWWRACWPSSPGWPVRMLG
ncbi:hypothetical protein [Nocardia sp. NPDC051981]